jgi:ribosomal protein L19E
MKKYNWKYRAARKYMRCLLDCHEAGTIDPDTYRSMYDTGILNLYRFK